MHVQDFGLYSTYGWHPRAVAVALANLRYLMRHRKKLLKNATELGHYFLTRLSQMRFKSKATVRGKGFAIGIEVKNEDYASEVGDACRENGLLVSAEEDVLMLFPALTITRRTAQRGLDIFERSSPDDGSGDTTHPMPPETPGQRADVGTHGTAVSFRRMLGSMAR